MRMLNSFFALSFAVLAAACAGPDAKPDQEANAKPRYEPESGLGVQYAECYDEFGRPVRHDPHDPRYGFQTSCSDNYPTSTYYEHRRPALIVRPAEPPERPSPLPLPDRIGLFPR